MMNQPFGEIYIWLVFTAISLNIDFAYEGKAEEHKSSREIVVDYKYTRISFNNKTFTKL